jgi:hypothetical protein
MFDATIQPADRVAHSAITAAASEAFLFILILRPDLPDGPERRPLTEPPAGDIGRQPCPSTYATSGAADRVN